MQGRELFNNTPRIVQKLGKEDFDSKVKKNLNSGEEGLNLINGNYK